MSAALRVQDLDVLFGNDERPSHREMKALILPRTFDEPRGYRVGLADVTFSVNGGDCLAVLGASGDGKSSLLRTLAGLQVLRRGQVVVNGRDVTALPPEKRGVVYLHQEPVLFPHLAVHENVAFPLTLRGVPKRDAVRRGLEWLERLQVSDVSGNMPDALSGGQRHRVALARALCAEPAVLLLDEPLASLDPAVRRDVRAALLEARAASGAAMVLVTHDLDDALAVATHMSLIDWMTLTTPREPAALIQAPPSLEAARLVGIFSEITGEVVQENGGRCFHWIGGTLPAGELDAGPAVACVRSHEVTVERSEEIHPSTLLITDRRDAAHDVVLTLCDTAGGTVTVSTSGNTRLGVGDGVVVAIAHARVFADRGRPRV
ncbi:MAG: ATP-binding cassette domain-containing protein [Gemmatimonadaceae bacterium]|nr:ATP-binding cassette domain-containing protein [Gemmatimonadaceae bacterium]